MKVSKDFFMYKSGVYRCTNLASESRTGYHSVRILGWGEEYQNGKIVKYWVRPAEAKYYLFVIKILKI